MQIVDSYSESNYANGSEYVFNTDNWRGITFAGNGRILNGVRFYLKRSGTDIGTVVVKIYAHTGTYGTNGKPTGEALATSDIFDASTISTSMALRSFVFSGANKITLVDGTKYCAVLQTVTWGGQTLLFGIDITSPSHGGNLVSSYNQGSTWSYESSWDGIFYVYSDTMSPFPSHFNT